MSKLYLHLGSWPFLFLALTSPSLAFELSVQKVTDNVYALIGSTGGRTYDNYGLNNNLGFIITPGGVVLIDSGSGTPAARMVEKTIKGVTNKPIRWVINTGSQDHRWLGNRYFSQKGAQIIALARTAETQKSHAAEETRYLAERLKDHFGDTTPLTAPEPVQDDQKTLNLGGEKIALMWLGDAHFPGDAVVWLPQQNILFSGDLVYVDRILGIHPWSNILDWQKAFHKMEALQPKTIIPGHGQVCLLEKAQQETGAYLDWLIENIGQALEDWKDLDETVDSLKNATQFRHLRHFESWHPTNVNRAYLQMEQLSR